MYRHCVGLAVFIRWPATVVNIPLAIIEGIADLFATGGVLSIASLVGFISLSGITSRNVIVMRTGLTASRL